MKMTKRKSLDDGNVNLYNLLDIKEIIWLSNANSTPDFNRGLCFCRLLRSRKINS